MTMNKEEKIESSCSVVGEWSQQLSFILFYEVGIFIFLFRPWKREHLDWMLNNGTDSQTIYSRTTESDEQTIYSF